MTLLTEQVVRRLQQAGPLTFCNYAHGRASNTPYSHAIRVLRTIRCLATLAWNGRAPGGRLYLVANARSGLLLTALAVFIGRQMSYRIYLHHHTYGYIEKHNRWMEWIDRRMSNDGVHIVHCQQMMADFRRQYDAECGFDAIFPSVVSIEISSPRPAANKPFRLGVLSNLTVEKGVDLAIEAFRKLHASGCPVRLDLAGPVRSRAARKLIGDAEKSYPGAVHYCGPVYGKEKSQFLCGIDALLFPTRYADESWGIVLNEALAAGAPVITFDRGCTKTVVGSKAGLVVDRNADYVSLAAEQIQRWIDDAQAYRLASQAAIEQADYLHREGGRMLDEFAKRFCRP